MICLKQKILLGFLILMMVVSFLGVPRQSEAFLGAGDPATIAAQIKEYILDGVAFAIINKLIDRITDSVVAWINNGFDGNPSFLTNYKSLLGDAADVAFEGFLASANLESLCSPFQVELQIAILSVNRFEDRIQCTIEDIVENLDDFIAGDFDQGGWEGWFELTQGSANNPYGAYFVTQGELARLAQQKVEEETSLLDFGQGFFSKKTCAVYIICDIEGPPDPAGNSLFTICNKDDKKRVPASQIDSEDSRILTCDREEILTPGNVIENSLNNQFGLAQGRIQVADEINEIIGALMQYILGELLSSDPNKGLRTLDPSEIEGEDYGAQCADANNAEGCAQQHTDPSNIPPSAPPPGDFCRQNPDLVICGGDTPGIPNIPNVPNVPNVPGGPNDNGGGDDVVWSCLSPLSNQPASSGLSVNLGNYTGDGGGGFGQRLRINGTEVNKFYRSATIDFDITVDNFDPFNNNFTSFGDFARSKIRGTYAGYWGIGIAHRNGTGTYVDRHGASFTRQNASWTEGQKYHITITQDAQTGTVNLRSDAGHNHTFSYTTGSDIADTGDGLFLWLPRDVGYTYENISVSLTPGGPYNGGVRGPCSGN